MTHNAPLVSIIVPVYNAQPYLTRCIDSIIHQEYRNIEVLLIDDGSTDGSGARCDDYAKKDPRIKVVHQPNAGVSKSRNTALGMAQGTYIQFADSDDWITPDATKLFVRSMLEFDCDMVISDFYRVSGERVSPKGDIEETGIMNRQQFAGHMMENPADFYYGVLWNKLFKRKIIEQHQIRMDESLDWCEDFLFNLEYIRHARTFYALQAPVYYYFKRKGSLVYQGMSITNTLQMKVRIFEYYNNFYKDLYDKESYENIRLQVYGFLLSSAKDGMILAFMKNTRLGRERNGIYHENIGREGMAMNVYRFRKLLSCHLDTIARKNDLTLEESSLLYYLFHSDSATSLKSLADFSNMSPRKVSALLARLEKKKLIDVENGKKPKKQIAFRPEAEIILKDIEFAEREMDLLCFAGLSPKEITEYKELAGYVTNNIIDFLKGWQAR